MKQEAAEEVVKALATETQTPLEIVARMYEQTWAEFSDGARVMDYLTVLVSRRVREDLRTLRKDAH
ncbi:DUF3562 domain-containing protein [Paraburkholderia sp. CNPSo 3274]|uniref:DUF3562 domain-containing protein n=1 Tax=Paraburkholderia sp. CNPSo 3274 TaxID=2940932 RepID=UPI0020B7C779|nr:DUF3562 domain-containing protein [Paraburkholderia sp. CNPSo 3274]MCP3710023.1 DUF3562 domain-containing protein [Paraburkholderia sp. CNPSo 3274]